MRIILFRNVLFALVISIVPALLPVIALREMQLSAAQLGHGGLAPLPLYGGRGVANAGLDLIFAAAALVALAGLALGHRFSINFATEASVEAPALNHPHCRILLRLVTDFTTPAIHWLNSWAISPGGSCHLSSAHGST